MCEEMMDYGNIEEIRATYSVFHEQFFNQCKTLTESVIYPCPSSLQPQRSGT